MKKSLLSLLLVFVLVISMMPGTALAQTKGSDSSQTASNGGFVNGKQVISDMIKNSGEQAHPRIIMSEEKFAKLNSHIGDGSVTARLLEDLRGEANRHLKESVATYDADDEDHLLETSKRIQRRVAALALAYNIFGDEKYAERAYKELKAACDFPDWSPKHFLDTAEMCTAFAFGYDWLYNWMTPEQRTLLRTNMIEKGLNQVMEDYTDTPRDRKRTYKWYQDQVGDNWQLVCTGGTDLVALAIGDEEDAKAIASEALDYGFKRAYSFVRRAYSTNDGTYIEGLGYWDYATYYLGLQSSALISATGTDYGLADYEGLRKSVDFIRYMSSNSPKSFSFGDDRESRNTGWAVFLWLGEYLNAPELSAIRLKNIGHDDDGFRYLDVLWIDESKQTGVGEDIATDWGAVGACNASFRNTWDDSGIVTALHVGENNYKYHGHYDLGSFYIESNGSRFFTDLGNESYSLTNRQYSYRIKPEGHNTLVINPTTGTDQREGANCLITDFQSGNEAYAVTDLTDAYSQNGAKSVVRGLKMIKDKECVIIQDEISLNAPGDIYWFAHTKGTISVASDGRSAIVTVGSDKLWVGLMSEGGKFTAMKAEPLSTSLSVPGATSNSDYRKLAIHLTATKDTTISVACMPLKNGNTSPSWTPSIKAISEWSREDVMHTHAGTEVAQVNATCTKDGVKAYYKCSCGKYYSDAVCNKEIVDLSAWMIGEGKIEKTGHTTETILTRATLSTNGKKETKCTVCNEVTRTEIIYAVTNIKLSNKSYVYDGKTKKPAVTVEDSAGNAIATTNYSVKYDDGRKLVGKYKVVITLSGDYKGSKSLFFTISPKSTTLKTVTPSTKAFTVTWSKKTAQVDGYQIQYALDEKFTNSAKQTIVTKNTTTSKKVSSLQSKKTYYVRIRTYKKVGTKKYYSDWSKGLSVKTR